MYYKSSLFLLKINTIWRDLPLLSRHYFAVPNDFVIGGRVMWSQKVQKKEKRNL